MSREIDPGGGQFVVVVGDDSAASVAVQSLSADVLFVGPDERTTGRVGGDVETSVVANIAGYCPPADADAAIVATRSDSANLLVAQQFRLNDTSVVIRLNDRDNRSAFETLDAEVVCAATNVGDSLSDRYTSTVAPLK